MSAEPLVDQETEGLEGVYKRLLVLALRWVSALPPTAPQPEARDLVQETFVRDPSSPDRFDAARASRFTYLAGVMKNVLREDSRVGRHERQSVSDEHFVVSAEGQSALRINPWPEVDARLVCDRITLVASADENGKAFVEAARKCQGDGSVAEIARIMKRPYAKVRADQKRLRRRLRRMS